MGARTSSETKSGGASDPEIWWRSRARETAALINLGWWLDTLVAPLIIGSAVMSAAILVWRNQHGSGDTARIALIAFSVIAGLAIACGLRARRRFESSARSLVRLEAALGLHNALSAADAGVAPWPSPMEKSAARLPSLRWEWRRLTLAPTVALATLAGTLWIPVGANRSAATPPPPQLPLAWSQLDAELDALMETAAIEETYIEETRERIDQLRAHDAHQWYSHHTMEATDAIVRTHRDEANRLEDALRRAERAIEHMGEAAPDDRHLQFDEYQNALDGMENGQMRPNDALREQLKQINPENLGQLTPKQLDQLRGRLREANDAIRDALQEGEGDGEPGENGDPVPMPGGQPDDNGAHAPGVLGNLPEHQAGDGEFTPMAARDLSNAALGDLLEIQTGAHEPLQDAPVAPTPGGETTATGRGGDRIWRESLDPAEQRTLRGFFE